jgi:hypothetical protein
MPASNRISAEISPAVKEEVLTHIREAQAKLSFLVSLTNEEKKNLRKMGQDSIPYVEDTLRGVKSFPDVFPPTFDKTEFARDATLISDLRDIQVAVNAFGETLADTLMAAGIDAMSEADLAYGYLKTAAKNNVNIKQLVDEIGRRFEGQGRKKTTPSSPPNS